MEKIDKGKDKKHITGKLISNPEDKTPYITCQIQHALGTDMQICSMITICDREGSEYTSCLVRIAKINQGA